MHSPLELAPDHVEKIGLISVRWSALENGLAELLGRFLRVDHSGEAAYFAISNFSQRLGIISAVAEYSIENDRDAAVIARLLEKIEGLWGQRNKYIHSHFVHRTTYADGVQIMLYSDGGEPFRPSNLDSGDLQVVKSEFGYLRTKRKSPREFVPINLGALQNHAKFHLKKYYDFNKSNLLKYKFIFEFGGGYGNMAHTFKRINPKIKYIIFDTPEVNLLQYYYLSKCNLSVGIGIKNIYKNIVLLSSIDELKKIIKINQFKKKLFIANWSLSETPLIFREKLKFIFKYFDDQLISFQNKFEKVDNFKFFKKINAINIKKKRMSIIIPVPMLKNNNYLFSKKINEKN